MKVLAQPRDTERFVVDYLTPLLDDATVGVGVPSGWKSGDAPHLEVSSDGDPSPLWPVATRSTIRLTARAGSTTEAKALCGLAFGLLCAHNGDIEIVGVRPLTGVLPARDPETHVELASATARVTVRTEPIVEGS